MDNPITQLRQEMLSKSTKAFNARGSIVNRCPQCMLATFACMCPWQLVSKSNVRFTIIIHRNELFKTTNTGRLIAELFPHSTGAYLWSRTEPDSELLSLINDKQTHIALLFPESNKATNDSTQAKLYEPSNHIKHRTKLSTKKPVNILLLDGTWKQAARMANLSPWLQHLPRLQIETTPSLPASSYIRKAQHDHQVSSAQAAAMVLRQLGEPDNAILLEHYFSIFNQHCKATRSNVPPSMTDSHDYISKVKHHATN